MTKKKETLPETEELTPIEPEKPDATINLSDEQAEQLRSYVSSQEESKIPGNKFMFNVDEKYLPEASRLNDREIYALAVQMTQREASYTKDPNFDVAFTFMNWLLRLRISRDGEGREEFNLARQAELQQKEAEARSAAFGGGL
jgi:hypothetical protein